MNSRNEVDMGNIKDENMEEEKSVYEEWRTYPPVPDIKIKTEILSKTSIDTKINVQHISNGKNKK